jgi:ketosteroid isomerase-like protein
VTNLDVVQRLAAAMEVGDLDARDVLLDEDVIQSFPQSGEQFRGRQNLRAIIENYPDGAPAASEVRVVEDDERWALSPRFTVVAVRGSGDHFTMVARIRYPNADEWYAITFVELRDGRIVKLTDYFGQPFDAPEWRAPYREEPA